MNADIDHSTAAHRGPAQRTTPTHHFTLRLSATPRGARLARRLAAEQLHTWGWPYDTEANQTAALLVAELSTNAAVHGRVRGRDFRLRLTLHPADATLRIELTDPRPDRRPPAPGSLSPACPEQDSGRGLLLVEALSTHWGTACGDPYTKTVWCEVALK
ncbi:ATP-binding protein [Streptomyces spinoverrucosus]|uniref:ATP-binding protein n=1 Tax=Streptomyces spinoverrucosus TaxID=284043 RepID=UPI0018C40DBB|nr:ATP-binding protein [Streptomyces spinoverrucosus]MBG0851464.1 ATP-binding protein [Streptomyces spinoverrucosus]